MNLGKVVRLLEFYREFKEMTIQQLIYKYKFPICDRKTYARLLNNKYIKNRQSILYELFENVGLKLTDKKSNISYTQLHHDVEYFRNDLALQKCICLKKQMEDAKNEAFVYLEYLSLELIENYLENGNPCDEKKILCIIQYKDLFPDKLLDMLILIILYYYRRSNYKSQQLVQSLCFQYTHFLPIAIFQINYFNNQSKFLRAYDAEKRVEQLIQSDNYLALLDFYNQKARTLKMMNEDNIEYLNKIEAILADSNVLIPNRKRVQVVGNLVYTLIYRKEYKRAIHLINEIYEISGYRKLNISIQAQFCYSQLDCQCPDYFRKLDLNEYIDKKDLRMFKYFDFDKRSYQKRNEMALRIVKDLDEFDPVYWYMLREEITKNCKKTGRYAAMMTFYQLNKRILDELN